MIPRDSMQVAMRGPVHGSTLPAFSNMVFRLRAVRGIAWKLPEDAIESETAGTRSARSERRPPLQPESHQLFLCDPHLRLRVRSTWLSRVSRCRENAGVSCRRATPSRSCNVSALRVPTTSL